MPKCPYDPDVEMKKLGNFAADIESYKCPQCGFIGLFGEPGKPKKARRRKKPEAYPPSFFILATSLNSRWGSP